MTRHGRFRWPPVVRALWGRGWAVLRGFRQRRLTRREQVLGMIAGSLLVIALGGQLLHTLGERRATVETDLAARRRLLAVYRGVIARRAEILAAATTGGAAGSGGLSDGEAVAALAQLASGLTVETVFPSGAQAAGQAPAPATLSVDCRGDLTNLQHFLIRVESEAAPFRIARCRLAAEGGELACHLDLTYLRK